MKRAPLLRRTELRSKSAPHRVRRMTRDEAIGYALLETEHFPGFARRAPHFVEKLKDAGWQIIPAEPSGVLDAIEDAVVGEIE